MKGNSPTLKEIAGYTTESAVWRMLLNLTEEGVDASLHGIDPVDIVVAGDKFCIEAPGSSGENGNAFCAPESFNREGNATTEAATVWTLGALAFYAITGVAVFEGKGGCTQKSATEVPRISSAHASNGLSTLVLRCLSYNAADRPGIDVIRSEARKALAVPATPRRRLTASSGRAYTTSLVKFWPDEMLPCAMLLLMALCPLICYCQTVAEMVTTEMKGFVDRCMELRISANYDKVYDALSDNYKWTLMDEIAKDPNECNLESTTSLGLNDLGYSVLFESRGEVTNTSGRFRDGRDPRYKYSFFEIAVKENASVSYEITGREGFQLFAIVPATAGADFSATVTKDGQPLGDTMKAADGTCYISVREGLLKEDVLRLTISNAQNGKAAYAIINHNTHKYE